MKRIQLLSTFSVLGVLFLSACNAQEKDKEEGKDEEVEVYTEQEVPEDLQEGVKNKEQDIALLNMDGFTVVYFTTKENPKTENELQDTVKKLSRTTSVTAFVEYPDSKRGIDYASYGLTNGHVEGYALFYKDELLAAGMDDTELVNVYNIAREREKGETGLEQELGAGVVGDGQEEIELLVPETTPTVEEIELID